MFIWHTSSKLIAMHYNIHHWIEQKFTPSNYASIHYTWGGIVSKNRIVCYLAEIKKINKNLNFRTVAPFRDAQLLLSLLPHWELLCPRPAVREIRRRPPNRRMHTTTHQTSSLENVRQVQWLVHILKVDHFTTSWSPETRRIHRPPSISTSPRFTPRAVRFRCFNSLDVQKAIF